MSFYQIFDAFQDAVLVVDREGQVHYGNPGASILLEVSSRRLSNGRALSQFMTMNPDIASPGAVLEAVTEMTQSREIEFQLPSGRTGWVQVVLQPEPQGFGAHTESRWIMTLRDVTLEKTLHSKYKAELDQKESVIVDLRAAREALQKYSEQLEQMVEERTLKLREANALLKSILDSLGQGILVFERDGRCLDVYSQMWRRLFGDEPSGKKVEETTGWNDETRASFQKWRDVVFEEMLDFEDLSPLAPANLSRQDGIEIAFNYHPMRTEEGRLRAVVMVATDKTREMQALREAEREHQIAGRVTQVARHREAFRLFAAEAKRIIADLSAWPSNPVGFEEIARQVHTLKGGSASFFFMPVANACHEYENELSTVSKSGGVPSQESRAKLLECAKQVSEAFDHELQALVALLGPVADTGESSMVEIPLARLREWSERLNQARTVTTAQEIGGRIWSECMERPVASAVGHLESSLSEMAEELGKKLEVFTVEGGETTVPLYVARGFIGSLVHAFRNSIFHGLETPEERRAAGKPEGGRILARFQRVQTSDGPCLKIEIEDDGRGVDHEKLRAKLLERGFAEAAEQSPHELAQSILRGDLSTAEEVNSIAGRGVGLSAIASEAKRLGGRVVVNSIPGKGMRLEIQIPIRSEETASEHADRAA